MEFMKLGRSQIDVSRLGFGCDQLGLHDWGEVNSTSIQAAIRMALDRGINFFDTADCYGKGCSEELLTEALGRRRNDAVIATKFGVRFTEKGETYYDSSLEWLDEALDNSLRRLETDYIDLYQLHYWDEKTNLHDLFDRLESKVKDGKIRSYGVTNLTIKHYLKSAIPPNLVSFSREMSLATRNYEAEVSDTCSDYGLTFLSWGSLGQGILTGKYSSENLPVSDDRRSRSVYRNFHGLKLEKNMKILDALRSIELKYPGKTLSQLAIRALLDRFGDSVVLAGVKSSDQLIDNANSFGWRLDQGDLEQLFSKNFLD